MIPSKKGNEKQAQIDYYNSEIERFKKASDEHKVSGNLTAAKICHEFIIKFLTKIQQLTGL
jgi:hypothetical protein